MALKNSLHLLIMAGGSGTRFWPKSTAVKPKQLLALWDDKTLIEHTLERFEGTVEDKNAFVITTEKILGPTKEILKRHPEVRYLAEPTGKNTAPCILWGVLEVYKKNPDAVIAVLPADHFIGDVSKFLNTVLSAAEFASKNPGIVTLGIQPNKPETGYGYIEAASSGNSGAFQKVSRFVEKPDLRTANRYLEAGNYLWNAGMFIFKASEGYNAFKRCMPSLFSLFEKSTNIAESYLKISKEDSISVDYGVMERASQHDIPVWVLPTNCQWNDVGSFIALEEIGKASKGEVISYDSACNVTHTDKGILALLGVQDLIIVREGDTVLIASKDRAQDIKQLLEKVKVRRPDLV